MNSYFSYIWTHLTLFDVNQRACDLGNRPTSLYDCVHTELIRKFSHSSMKEIIYYCQYCKICQDLKIVISH